MPVSSNPAVRPTLRRLGICARLGAFCLISLAVPVSFGQDAKPAVARDVRSQATGARRVPSTPAAVLDLLVIQPFRLRVGYHHGWLQSRPFVTEGLLVVLRVDPSLVVPRNAAEPVLYAGDRTIHRLNKGHGSGFVIGIIPGALDLTSAPVWFGRPRLPERVTPDLIREERALAESIGIAPFSAAKIADARRDTVEVADLAALLRGPAADLVLKFSPDEQHLADTWRLPTNDSPGRR